MRIQVCYFCSGPVYPGHGMMFMRNDGKLFRFCRSKCHRHFKAKHNPRKTRWTKACRKLHGKEMTKDSVFEFEKRRNEPLVYNRDLFVTTIQCMKRLEEIRESREQIFWENRLKLAQKQKKHDKLRDLETHITLVSEPIIKEKIQENIAIKEKAAQLAQITSQSKNPHQRINDMEEEDNEN